MKAKVNFCSHAALDTPFYCCIGSEYSSFKKNLHQFNLVEIHFLGGRDRWNCEKERKRALQLIQRVAISI